MPNLPISEKDITDFLGSSSMSFPEIQWTAMHSYLRGELRHLPQKKVPWGANRKRNSCKVLRFDGTGMTIFMKRLERGLFAPLWARSYKGEVELSEAELALFLEGSQIIGYRKLSPPNI